MGTIEVQSGDVTRVIADTEESRARYAAAGFKPASKKSKSKKDNEAEQAEEK